MDKLVICSLAKDENAYINDWVKYHIDLGYGHIYLYDNNDLTAPYVGDCIDNEYRDKVTIIDVRGKDYRSKQAYIYNKFVRQYCNEYEWCTFIDIDEFVVSDDISGLLGSIPKDIDSLVLNWQIYGDDGVIDGDESVPVFKRIKNRLLDEQNPFNRIVKTTVRGGIKNLTFANSHVCTKGNERNYCNCQGKRVSVVNNHKTVFGVHDSHIAHYITKSLSEYLKYKIGRLSTKRYKNDALKLEYYFRFNEKTPEKLEFIRKWNESAKELNECAIK